MKAVLTPRGERFAALLYGAAVIGIALLLLALIGLAGALETDTPAPHPRTTPHVSPAVPESRPALLGPERSAP